MGIIFSWSGTYSRIWVDGTAVNIEIFFRQDLGSFVDGTSGAIKDTTQHVFRHTKLQALAGKFDFGLKNVISNQSSYRTQRARKFSLPS